MLQTLAQNQKNLYILLDKEEKKGRYKMFKKTIILVLISILILTICGCKKSEEEDLSSHLLSSGEITTNNKEKPQEENKPQPQEETRPAQEASSNVDDLTVISSFITYKVHHEIQEHIKDKKSFDKEFVDYLVSNNIISEVGEDSHFLNVLTAQSQPYMKVLLGTDTVIFDLKLDDPQRTLITCTVTGYDYLFVHY